MNRYLIENLFGIEGLNIAWYGIIIVFGMFLGGALAVIRSRKTGNNTADNPSIYCKSSLVDGENTQKLVFIVAPLKQIFVIILYDRVRSDTLFC